MPHAVIEGPVDLIEYARGFEPLLVRSGRDVLRADALYTERGGRAVLIEAQAIEAGRKLRFYVKITAHDRGSATVRIDPLCHVERSDGVREILARLASDLLERTPGARVGPTNLVVPFPRTPGQERTPGVPAEGEVYEDRE